MKRLVLVWVCIIIAAIVAIVMLKNDSVKTSFPLASQPTLSPPTATSQANFSLFVPYWSLTAGGTFPSKYTSLLYFGVAADINGLQIGEQGYTSIQEFRNELDDGQHSLLVLRLLDNNVNNKILDDPVLQQKIISQTIVLAKKEGFSGVVTDLELRALPFSSLIDKINKFHDTFSKEAKEQGLVYGISMYGDVFYRVRPFDMEHLVKDADMIYILAYDLHKTNGQPGPNFPIHATDSGDYDLKQMIQDYQRVVPADKIAVTVGLFGYDWQLDNKGNTVGNAVAISFDTIQKNYIQHCSEKECKWKRDPNAGEVTVTYIDKKEQPHVIWTDDPESANQKEKFLQQYGIHNFSYWAYGYF